MPASALPRIRPFSTAARIHPPLPFHPTPLNLPSAGAIATTHAGRAASSATMGPIARWYLPTMAFIALGFAIANGLEEYNNAHMSQKEREKEQWERQRALLDAYGERVSLSDVERALEKWEVK